MTEPPAFVNPPDSFDFNMPEKWPSWSRRFERYMSLSKLKFRGEQEKIDLLCYTMGGPAEEILMEIIPSFGNNDISYETVKKKCDNYFSQTKNVIFERFKFNSRIQAPLESVDDFVTALHILAASCEFGPNKHELIRDRMVAGLRDNKTCLKLQRTQDVSLEHAIAIAKMVEQVQIIRAANVVEATNVDEPERPQMVIFKTEEPLANEQNLETITSCYRCGNHNHSYPVMCPAFSAKCSICGLVGHFKAVCTRSQVHADDANNSGEATDVTHAVQGAAAANIAQMAGNAMSSITLRCTVRNCSTVNEAQLSRVYYVRNLPWQIKVIPNRNKQNQRTLGFYMYCNSSNTTWSCTATVTLKLLSHKPHQKPYCKSFLRVFHNDHKGWGFHNFIAVQDILNIEKGYIQDDTIILEAHLVADTPVSDPKSGM